MKHTKEEIINALKVIKDECESHNCGNECECGCDECCFNNYNLGCVISEMFPSDWRINEIQEEWRAFK